MKFNNPKILADALAGLQIQQDATESIEITQEVVPVIMVASAGTAYPKPAANQTLVTMSNGKTATAVTASTGVTIYSVPTGYRFNMIGLIANTSVTQQNELRDGGSGGTLKCGFLAATNGSTTIGFPVPIVFTTDIWWDIGSSGNIFYTISGYLEKITP